MQARQFCIKAEEESNIESTDTENQERRRKRAKVNRNPVKQRKPVSTFTSFTSRHKRSNAGQEFSVPAISFLISNDKLVNLESQDQATIGNIIS